MIHTVKGFGIVKKAEIGVFLELSRFFSDLADVGNLISGSSAFSKTSFNIWKFTFHVLLKPGLENFEHYLTSMWDECNCAVVWTFFGIAFLWDWNSSWAISNPKRWCRETAALKYVRKSGKLSSGYKIWKVQFSFQSQRKAIPKNVQTTAQLHSQMLAK